MMKPGVLFSLGLSLLFPVQPLTAQIQDPSYRLPLTYIESSFGLASPEWEGGNSELEFADINQDGNLDIITIGDHGNPGIQSGEQGIMVYFGDGQGNWSVQMEGDLGYGGIAAGDVNNDGFIDIGYGMHHNYSSTDLGDQLIEVALGNGTGIGWVPWDNGLATNGEDWGMFGTDFADVDNDGDLDLCSVSFGCCSGIHVYLNNLDGTWTQSWGFNGGNSGLIIQFGDINNDGAMDFAASHENGTAYFGDGNGGFVLNDTGLPSAGSLGRNGTSLGDVDKDGGMDLAFTSYAGGLFVYSFSETLNNWVNFSGNLPVSGVFEQTQLADMDMDGYTDLAAFGEGTIHVYLGDGNGNWTAGATVSTGEEGSCQAFRVGGDADHNGRPDFVLLEEVNISWFTYQNYLKFFKENSLPYSLAIHPVYPGGNELLRPGSVRFIDWTCAVPPGDKVTSQVRLELSTTGPDGPWTLIASQLPDNGRYQWTVPQENSADCYIRYTATSGIMTESAVTPAAFAITDGMIGVEERGSGEAGKRGSLEIWPNPAGDVVNCQLSIVNCQFNVWVTIYDAFGRKVQETMHSCLPDGNVVLDVRGLSPGMYTITARDQGDLIVAGRLVIAR